ncbi:tyrosine recombinase XerC [Rhizobium sp. RAF36]|uniref:site-specific integrase n=1 Tax=Rhizobium sp. RAF36 TaxID=3233055 RepID=UPI003F99FEBD
MIKPRLPRFCVFDPDRRGNGRYYVRKKGAPKIRIKAAFESRPGEISKAFMDEYWAALASIDGTIAAAPAKVTAREDTFNWLCDQYYRSDLFQRFDRDTQRDKRSVLTRFCEGAGELPYKKYRKEDMEKSQLKRRDKPGAADKLVKVIKALFNWAIEKKLATHNPAVGVAAINVGSEGFHTWTPEELDQFREFYPLGTKPRLAMEIMINIGARLSDAAGIGPRNETIIKGERWLRFTVKKNRKRFGPVTIEAPMTDELIAAIAATEIGADAYLVTSFGKPFVTAGLGNKMRDWCNDAHLPDCSSHGLRKAAAVALAENGASAPELCAIFGWTNLRTAQIYIDKANKRKMARNAFRRRERASEKQSVSLLKGKKRNETNEAKSDAKSNGK